MKQYLDLLQHVLDNGTIKHDRPYMPEVERGERNISLVVAEKIANALGEKLSKMID